jgi:hypothetical protein
MFYTFMMLSNLKEQFGDLFICFFFKEGIGNNQLSTSLDFEDYPVISRNANVVLGE